MCTSPPYWGLRDYGTASWKGGDSACDHVESKQSLNAGFNERWGNEPGEQRQEQGRVVQFKDKCGKCGAVREDKQIGLEPTSEEYYPKLVAVFREVRRVLRPDGVAWVNHGDCYYSSRSFSGPGENTDGAFDRKHEACGAIVGKRLPAHGKLKPKDLVGQAWQLAFALRDDGWWLRSACVWHKPNPLPESVTDRPAMSHEYVFLFTKQGKGYFYDAAAVRTGYAASTLTQRSYSGAATKDYAASLAQDPAKTKRGVIASLEKNGGANLKTVWTIPPQPTPEAHFATFPERLVETCIRAGTSERGCCATCGAPWRRVEVASGGSIGKAWHDHSADATEGQRKPSNSLLEGSPATKDESGTSTAAAAAAAWKGGKYTRETVGWEAGCEHGGEPVPCTVFDPFSGSGTTVAVALRLGRSGLGTELNPEYAQMAVRRIHGLSPTLARQGGLC